MNKPQIILGIESSCDETAAAVVQKTNNGVQILSNIVASSADLQAKYGGIIPEQAAREQLKSIIPVISEALSQAFSNVIPVKTGIQETGSRVFARDDIIGKIDAIAVTQGPGLIGSLLVGVETAKTLALLWHKPLIPVNHLTGHFYANWIINSQTANSLPVFPAIGLLVSGGHTDLILMEDHGKYKYLGGTRDDAAGEAFDKTARLLGLPYPGGPVIAKLAEQGNPKNFPLPRPMIGSNDLDFSFSGLKTAVTNLIQSSEFPSKTRLASGSKVQSEKNQEQAKADVAASIEEAVTDVLVKKVIGAIRVYNVDQVIIAGGVAANQALRKKLQKETERLTRVGLHIPPAPLCTDNAAYIAAAAVYNFHPVDPLTLQANPNLTLNRGH